MTKVFPTKCQLCCAGLSHILTQVLLIVTAGLCAPVYESYYVHDENDVIELHNQLQNSTRRAQLQITCILLWICYPLALISIYGISKILLPMVRETWAELFVYVLEKAYTSFALFFLFIPAVILSTVSFDWSFHETGDVPSGYYVQLGLIIFQLEFADCLFYANTVFLISVFIVIRFIIWQASNAQNERHKELYESIKPRCIENSTQCSGLMICGRECIFIGIPIIIFILVSSILCEFAKSGLFNPESFLKFGMVFVWIVHIALGGVLIWLAKGRRLESMERILATQRQILHNYNTPNMEELQLSTTK
eukprot:227850_1